MITFQSSTSVPRFGAVALALSAALLVCRALSAESAFLSGDQAVARMTVDSGFEVKLFAAEPDVAQPIAFCWDDRGRLWVAENRDYENRRAGFSKSGASRVVILEDTNGDGRMDRRTVYLESIPFPTAIARGFGGLWLGAPPNLLFIPDRPGEDRADLDRIQVRLTGWGIQDRHETLNSFNWGPDGWLYGCQGFATRSTVGKPADGGRVYKVGERFPSKPAVTDPIELDGGIWRYHPVKDRFEVVAHGFSNPWGVDFDDHGQMFATACVIPHLWHIIPGGVYQRQGGRHLNPHVYSDLQTIADHRHQSAHGGARVYLADAFPADYRGRILMANIHEHALLDDILEPRGSGFVGRHGGAPVLANDPQWVGFSVEIGPEGAVYILDWHDNDICGLDVKHPETGRIYRFAPPGLPGRPGLNLAGLSDLELVACQQDRNDWHVRRARVLLQERAASGRLADDAVAALRRQFDEASTAAGKLRALWALHVTNRLPPERLLALIDHPMPAVRGWAIRLLGEDRSPSDAAVEKLAARAKVESSPAVRLELAAALQRMEPARRWELALALVRHAGDAADANLPLMIWFGIEPLVPADAERAFELGARSAIPLLTRYIVRRAVAADKLDAIVAALANPDYRYASREFLAGLRDGLAAFKQAGGAEPAGWRELSARLSADGDAPTRELVAQIGQQLGDARAVAAQLALLRDPATPLERRREILATFARNGTGPALTTALALLDEPELRRDALRALASFSDPAIAPEILRRFSSLTPAERSEAVLTLAARTPWANRLLGALKGGRVERKDVSAFAARQLARVIGPSFVDFWGPVASPPDAGRAEIARLKAKLGDAVLAQANPSAGRAIFERTCAACHTLYGQGGKIGPDITGSNRANLDYLLGEIVTPSDVIQEGYHLVTIGTRDGRTLAGNIAAEDDSSVTLRLIGQETRVAKSDIVSREQSPVSMMPEGLLRNLSETEVRDLVGYLRTSHQVPLPAR